MEMVVKMMEVSIVMMMMAPAVFRRHQERGGESPPSSSSLTFPLDGRRVPLWSLASMAAEGREPLRDWISLSLFPSVSALPDSALSPFLKFSEIPNSDWAEMLTHFLSGY